MEFSIDGEFDGGLYGMTFKFEGFDVPSSINPSSIGLNVIEPASETGFDRTNSAGVYRAAFDDQNEVFTFNPATVSVSGTKVTITLPDVRPEGEVTKKAFDKGSNFRVLIYASAGISNPTEANTYGGEKGIADGDREIYVEFAAPGVSTIHFTNKTPKDKTGIVIPRILGIDPEDGGLGTTVTATGNGFKNGTTLTVFLDGNADGELNSGEDVLCIDPSIGSDDVGTCQFNVTHPTFRSGADMNMINAVDGRDGYVSKYDGMV